jgi:hypothetical protein
VTGQVSRPLHAILCVALPSKYQGRLATGVWLGHTVVDRRPNCVKLFLPSFSMQLWCVNKLRDICIFAMLVTTLSRLAFNQGVIMLEHIADGCKLQVTASGGVH